MAKKTGTSNKVVLNPKKKGVQKKKRNKKESVKKYNGQGR